MDLIQESFERLYPNKAFDYAAEIVYTGRFKPFNANIRKTHDKITLNLSKSWKNVDKEIVIGLIQELLVKLFKSKKNTSNMEMYNSYIKNLHKYTPKTRSDPILESSFHRVNLSYFDGMIDIPNLKLGQKSVSSLGSYSYATDTITISSALLHDLELVDYVMYHELLHKKHQFKSKNGRSRHHTTQFRKDEKAFPNSELMEKRLSRLRVKKFLRLI